jgi:uncharacterized protein with HEPN domain
MPIDRRAVAGAPSRDDRVHGWISDILQNIEIINRVVAAETRDSFISKIDRSYAVQYALIVISEASRRLPAELKARHRDLPWRQIADLRNAYTHENHRIDPARIWRTATEALRPLEKAMRAERDRLDARR